MHSFTFLKDKPRCEITVIKSFGILQKHAPEKNRIVHSIFYYREQLGLLLFTLLWQKNSSFIWLKIWDVRIVLEKLGMSLDHN